MIQSMFIPIGDSPNVRATPWVTYALIALNVVIFIATWPLNNTQADAADPAAQAYAEVIAKEQGLRVTTVSAYDAVVFRYGFKPAFPSFANMLTSMFLHGGLLHLLGNMLFLWIYGDNVEHRLGRLAFLAAYLGTGLAAALGDGLLRMGSAIPSVGASGAISGILGFYFIWFPKNRVRVWVFLFPIFMNVVELPARLVLGIYLVLDNIIPALLSGSSGGVAYGAHLGGFAAAAVLAVLIDKMRLLRPERTIRSKTKPGPTAASPTRMLLQDLERGDLTGALSAFMEIPAKTAHRELDPDIPMRLGKALEQGHLPHAALAVYQRLTTEHPDTTTRAAARLGAARVLLDDLGMPVEAYQQIIRALELNPPREIVDQSRAMLARLESRGAIPRRFRGGL